jgi:hypothetical protein
MRALPVVCALVLGGCAGEYREPVLGAGHPASVDAAAAPTPQRSGVLAEREPVGGARAAAEHEDHAHDAPAGAAQGGAADYTCPMHPEVVSDGPGRCPKCGMALVEKEGGK